VTYRFAPSFDRSFRRLPLDRQRRVQKAVDRTIDLLEAGQLPVGLGLKRLRASIWEFRAGLADRIIFRLEGSEATFVLAGNHDEIRRYLKGL